MRILQFNLFLLILMALLLFGCVPAAGRITPSPSVEFAPTVAPPNLVPTVTLNPLTPTMLPLDSLEATVTARATASPFPTAGTVEVKAGTPTSATTRRDGLSFSVELPKDSYLAGEGGRASIILRNDGLETLFIYGDGRRPAQVVLLDEQGHEPAPYPWFSPPVKQTLGKGPFISRDEAVAHARDHSQQAFTLLDARLVPEVDVRRPFRACSATIQGHFDGLWMLTVKYIREGTEFTAEWFLNAINGEWLCGAEISANVTPFSVTIPPGAPTPAPTRTPFPTLTPK